MTQQSHSQAYTLRKPKLRDTYIPLFIAALFTIGRTWKQARCPSTDEWIKKLWCIYTIEYYSAIKRNGIDSADVEKPRTCHTELSQKEKNQYHILKHIYGIQKNGTDEPICRTGIEKQIQRTDFGYRGKQRVEPIERVALKHIYYHM